MADPVKSPSEMEAEQLFFWLCKNPHSVVITSEEAARIYKLFSGSPISSTAMSSTSRRALMQAVFIRVVDASYALGFVEALFQSAFFKPVVNAKSFGRVLSKLVRKSLQNIWRHAKNKDIMQAEVYSIAVTHAYSAMKPYFQAIDAGLDPYTLD